MAKASGTAAEGEASGSSSTSGSGGGGFELNSVTPTAVKNTLDITAGGIFGSNFPPRRFDAVPYAVGAVAVAALVGAFVLFRRVKS